MSKDNLINTSSLGVDADVICNTDHLGIVKINGEDAQDFLQGQFSNDVKLLNNETSEVNSYNSPKGRMYASFRLLKQDDNFFILLPKEVLEPVAKRLRMFVLRSKVVLEDLSEQWSSVGLNGNKILDALKSQGITLPTETNQVTNHENCYFICTDDSKQRLLVFGPKEEVNAIINGLQQFPIAENAHWRRLDIHAGFPTIFAKTQEEFVAQMVNLQLVNGVSFTKGCYPGQEVVARMHYLGKLKKRMYRVTIESTSPPEAGENIYVHGSGNSQSIGQIVDAQPNEQGSIDALVVLQIAHTEGSDLRLGSQDGAKLDLQSLPYAFQEAS